MHQNPVVPPSHFYDSVRATSLTWGRYIERLSTSPKIEPPHGGIRRQQRPKGHSTHTCASVGKTSDNFYGSVWAPSRPSVYRAVVHKSKDRSAHLNYTRSTGNDLNFKKDMTCHITAWELLLLVVIERETPEPIGTNSSIVHFEKGFC